MSAVEELLTLADEPATAELAARLAAELLPDGTVSSATVFLRGDLGVGKTTFTRYFLRACGMDGPVKSPTYTLVEPYELAGGMLYHFDLYRINDPWELELAGFADLFDEPALRFVEWPERGADWLPQPLIEIDFETALVPGGSGVGEEPPRRVCIRRNPLRNSLRNPEN